jgi:ketosteroid isomerase-like protein
MQKQWIAGLCAFVLIAGCAHDSPKTSSKTMPAEPAATKSVKAEAKIPGDKTKGVTAAIDSWAAAWSKRDVDGYLAAYAPDFKPEKGKRSAWEKQRRERVGKAKHIKVTVGTPQITSNGADQASARFTQVYESDSHTDTSEKKLEFRLVDGKWRITRETSL